MLVPQELLSMCVTGQSGPRLASVWCPPFRASPPLTTCSPLVWRNQKTCFANLRLLIWPDAGFCSDLLGDQGWCQSAIWGIKPVTCLTQPETVSRWFDRSADPTQMGSTGVPPLRFPPLELISCGVGPPVLPHLLLLLFWDLTRGPPRNSFCLCWTLPKLPEVCQWMPKILSLWSRRNSNGLWDCW